MDILEAIKRRNSVRSYIDKPIDKSIIEQLNKEIDKCNQKRGLGFQMVIDEKEAFNSFLAKYGKFKNVKNYIILKGKKDCNLDEKVGYYGQHIALKIQQLGLNSCWVGLTMNKRRIKRMVNKEEKLVCVLVFGYGANQGIPHKSKKAQEVCIINGIEAPEWFKKGIEMALLAPTAVNQQRFLFTLLSNNKVKLESKGGFYSKVDLGIVKYHFEVGSGKNNFI